MGFDDDAREVEAQAQAPEVPGWSSALEGRKDRTPPIGGDPDSMVANGHLGQILVVATEARSATARVVQNGDRGSAIALDAALTAVPFSAGESGRPPAD
jgi:hypothetical protein